MIVIIAYLFVCKRFSHFNQAKVIETLARYQLFLLADSFTTGGRHSLINRHIMRYALGSCIPLELCHGNISSLPSTRFYLDHIRAEFSFDVLPALPCLRIWLPFLPVLHILIFFLIFSRIYVYRGDRSNKLTARVKICEKIVNIRKIRWRVKQLRKSEERKHIWDNEKCPK